MFYLIKFLNRQFLFVLGVCSLINSSLATNPIDLPDERPQTSSIAINLKTIEEWEFYTTSLKSLFEAKKYVTLLEFANYDIIYSFFKGVPESQRPPFLNYVEYSRSYYLAHAKYNWASEDRSDINKSINYCNDALLHLDSYLTQYQELNDKGLYGYLPYLLEAEIFSLIGVLRNGKASPSDIDEIFIKAFNLLNQAETIASRNGIRIEKMLDLKWESLSLCFANAPRLSPERFTLFKDYVNKVEDICKFITKNKIHLPQDVRQDVLKTMGMKLELMKNSLQSKMLETTASHTQKLHKTNQIKLNNYKNRREQIRCQIMESNRFSSTPSNKLICAHKELESLLSNRSLALSNETTPLSIIQNIENVIREQLTPSDPPSLEEIYQYYFKVFQSNGMVDLNNINVCATIPFIEAGLLEEARARLNIIANIEYKENGKHLQSSRILKAIINNMLGDHEEWLALVEEGEKAQLQVEEAKTNKNKNRHKRQVNKIKNAQKNQQNKANTKQVPQTKSTRPPQDDDFVTPPDHTLNNFEPIISLKEEKAAKIERHEAAERKRTEEAQQNEAAAESNASPEKNELAPVPIVSPQPLKTIKECYHLTTAAERVDDQIVSDKWEITRGQLENYFRVLGCQIKKDQGKGGHQKVSLPESLSIYKGNELITIINTSFGGALTLPNWDKSYRDGTVPPYLRWQILEARKKLVKLRLAAEDAAKKED